jgi:hypothetical protein
MNPTDSDPTSTPAGRPDPGAIGQPLIREWHSMTDAEQAAAWTQLVDWVVWIHDLYELSREERLPLCWHRHPGLIEELRSLKAWREHVYDQNDATSAPHTARSWHGELRQSITAAIGFWAPGCRTGHTDAALLADTHPDLAGQWHTAGPPVLDSAPAPNAPTGNQGVEVISNQDMFAALESGTARRHSRAMPHYITLDGSWWTRGPDHNDWARCTDPDHAALLERTSTQLGAADTAHDTLTDGKEQR